MVSLGVAFPAAAQTAYVDANLTTGADDGSSWVDAYRGPLGLQAALAATGSGDIFAADGFYRTAAPNGQRDATFRLKNNVRLYGGFEGGELDLNMRPPVGMFLSILTGDFVGNDDIMGGGVGDNAFHVVDAGPANTTNATAVLDGFVVISGTANGGGNRDRGAGLLCLEGNSPTIRGCTFRRNFSGFAGGAAFVAGSPSFEGCCFEGNLSAGQAGGVAVVDPGTATFDRCAFRANRAPRTSALGCSSTQSVMSRNCLFVGNTCTSTLPLNRTISLHGAGTVLQNCTIVNNETESDTGSAIYVNPGSTIPIRNCIVWGNRGPSGAPTSAQQISGGALVDHCLVTGGYAGGTGILTADPMFTDAGAGDYTTGTGSPVVDAGRNFGVLSTGPVDLAGQDRYVDDPATLNTGAGAGAIDVGAYEYQPSFVGTGYCFGNTNAVGLSGKLLATGSSNPASNDLTLFALDMPPGELSLFITGQTQGFTPNPAGSRGDLCLGGGIGRFQGPGQIMATGPSGTRVLPLDLTAFPTPMGLTGAVSGQSWNFQVWHRETVLGIPSSNFTGALEVLFL